MTNRSEFFSAQLQAAADQMVRDGVIGVALSIEGPGFASPLRVASGHRDLQKSARLDGAESFAIASQSKMFTAAMVHRLVAQGAVALTDPVSRYVPDVPAVDAEATIAQYLNHTSGIGNFIQAMTTLPFPWPRMSYEDLLGLARMQGRQSAPGESFAYNNTDVVVLARLCERVGGAPLGTLLREHLFEPLGMRDTRVAGEGSWPIERMARGYYVPAQGYAGEPLDVSRLPDYSIAGAAGNLVSTLADLQKFARSLLLPSPASGLTLDRFATRVAESQGITPNWFFPRAYGLGMERWLWAGRHFWGHRGSFFGYHSGTFVDPVSRTSLSLFLTMCTAGSFMRFIDLQAYDYMALLAASAQAAVAVAELP